MDFDWGELINMKDDLASILVLVYNKEEFLPKYLESLRNQTYKNIESFW